MIWEEYFPLAFSIGVSIDDFKRLTPKTLGYCLNGESLRRKNRDMEMWMWWRDYGIAAMSIGARKGAWGKGKLDYPSEPTFHGSHEEELTEDEIKRQREAFVLRMRTMKKNWDLAHKK